MILARKAAWLLDEGLERLRGVALRGAVGRLVEREGRGQVLHCFGDSHAKVFRDLRRAGLLERTWLDVTVVRGATALGLANPNSKTAALPTFHRIIQRIAVGRPLLFMLGEVDCGYLIWYRAARFGVSVHEQMRASVDNYTRFLDELRSQGRRRIVVASVPPPTIRDDQPWGEVATARREVHATLQDRTDLTHVYNENLREWASTSGCQMLDYEGDVVDASTGLVREELRSSDPLDHHVEPDAFSRILAVRLRELGFV
jgi:hypothetical protein